MNNPFRRNPQPPKPPQQPAAPPAAPAPPRSPTRTTGQVGDLPVSSSRGDVPAADTPNVPPVGHNTPWFLPQLVTVPANGNADVHLPRVPERVTITQIDAGAGCSVALAPSGGGFLIPMGQGAQLVLPGQVRDFSLVNPTGTATRFLVLAAAGYGVADSPQLVTASAGGGGGGNVTIVGPVNGSGFVETAVQSLPNVTLVAGQSVNVGNFPATQPVSGTITATGAAASGTAVTGNPVLVAGSNGTNAYTWLVDAAGHGQVNVVGSAAAPITVTPNLPAAVVSGQVSSGATATQLAAHALTSGLVVLSCPTANTAPVYVGPTGVTTTTGLPINPGQAVPFIVSNTNALFVISAAAQTVGFVGS